ncbi:Uncharacterised protein [Mycobacteroides abscessus subsp. abscessus]|nr:Uncharacterised protein [Mycobacteroides abscessus subsp. abscessus]
MTSSPGTKPSTPAPTAAMVPEISSPRRIGSLSGSVPKAPEYSFQSMGLTPAALTLMSTCPGPGPGVVMSRNSRTSAPPYDVATIACVMFIHVRNARAHVNIPDMRDFLSARACKS